MISENDFLSGIKEKLSSKLVNRVQGFSMSRSLALCSLLTAQTNSGMTTEVFEAVRHFGLAGMQWASKLTEDYNVTINVTESVQDYVENCVKSSTPTKCKVQIISEDPHVMLHSKRFSFIYIEADGSAVPYLSAAMRSITHGGTLCVSFSDIPALMGRCPERVSKLYGAKLLKTEYIKELGSRVIIANLVRIASH